MKILNQQQFLEQRHNLALNTLKDAVAKKLDDDMLVIYAKDVAQTASDLQEFNDTQDDTPFWLSMSFWSRL